MTMQALLDKGLATLEINASAEQRAQWLAYVQLLAKWNQAYNPTAGREPREMVSRHLLDSLAVASTHPQHAAAGCRCRCRYSPHPAGHFGPERQLTALTATAKDAFCGSGAHRAGLAEFQRGAVAGGGVPERAAV
ncbi:MAG: class I SAM-dependent methyltransferase [Cellvibrionales bacterium]|nr:class I SAM-dependent methyltransferase [Cellvibrionales bacterium]